MGFCSQTLFESFSLTAYNYFLHFFDIIFNSFFFRFFFRVSELQGNIRVICRVRPVLEIERKMGEDVDVTEVLSEVCLLL